MVKVLCVHGVGHQEANLAWQSVWRNVIVEQLALPGNNSVAEVLFCNYDDLFTPYLNNLSAEDIAKAVIKLGGGVFPQARALSLTDLADEARWTAGMVVVWVENGALRQAAWQKFIQDVDATQPDVICAHSLGSLISYDGLRRQEDRIQGRTFLTFGCQLGNFFVRGAFGGHVMPFDSAACWHDLYNPYDHVFTAPLDFDDFRTSDKFRQVETQFGSWLPWPLNHDAVNTGAPDHAYLTHPQTEAAVWPWIANQVARGVAGASAVAPVATSLAARAAAVRDAPTHRALLVGINAYPDPAHRLEGCVNDVFLVSSVLQECGFAAEDIRVVVDERATTAAIEERLHWLLDGTAPGDERFFYFSGHGASLPAYGVDGTVRHIDACLAPYDFAWTAQTAITDDRLVNFYSQLPYSARLMMMLDTCYSSAMTRGGVRARGLQPPDDIRHRILRWDARNRTWLRRQLPPAMPDADMPTNRRYVGPDGSTRLPGRAVALRSLPRDRFVKVRQELEHEGPYLPIVYEACGEREFAYEYRDGALSQGAFTYALAATLRRHGLAHEPVSFAQLLRETAETLASLRYDQHPNLVGPEDLLDKPIPWTGTH